MQVTGLPTGGLGVGEGNSQHNSKLWMAKSKENTILLSGGLTPAAEVGEDAYKDLSLSLACTLTPGLLMYQEDK